MDAKGIIRQKKLYLDPFMDMFNSEILSYRISEKPNALAIMEGLEELKSAIDSYIYYYNNERIKQKLNWQSPVQFRKTAVTVA